MPNPIATREMLAMQNTLNEMTNGPDWRSGRTQLGKVIDWRRCIVMETAELIDSYPWKHWKSVDAQTDMDNVRVELVDIWHFLLSFALENCDLETSADLLEKARQTGLDRQKLGEENTAMDQVAVHEEMMVSALQRGDANEESLLHLAMTFFNSCQVVGLSFEQLYQLYMAKNVLNKFRQDHGYKEGTYIKQWNGQEDNVVMFEIIAEMSVFSGEELYISLKNYYSQIG